MTHTTHQNRSSKVLWVLAAGLLAACGGNVEVEAGGGGEGGNGGTGAGTTTTTGNTGGIGGGTGGTGNTGGNTGGVGGGTGGVGNAGATGGMGGVGGGTGGGPGNCAGLGHVQCVGAFPSCVPVYDDLCCPKCDPMGGCADCINHQFHHCAPKTADCSPGACGFVPEWSCNGKEAPCDVDPGGSPEPCGTMAGCVPAYCNLNIDCTTDPVCHPVKANMCVAFCESIPPPCPDGTIAETNGSCWTGSCVPQDLCLMLL